MRKLHLTRICIFCYANPTTTTYHEGKFLLHWPCKQFVNFLQNDAVQQLRAGGDASGDGSDSNGRKDVFHLIMVT